MLYLELCPGAGLDPATWGHSCWQPQLPARRWVIGVLPHTTSFLFQVPHLLLSLIRKVPAPAQGLSLLRPGCAVPVPRAETLTSNPLGAAGTAICVSLRLCGSLATSLGFLQAHRGRPCNPCPPPRRPAGPSKPSLSTLRIASAFPLQSNPSSKPSLARGWQQLRPC